MWSRGLSRYRVCCCVADDYRQAFTRVYGSRESFGMSYFLGGVTMHCFLLGGSLVCGW